VTGLETGTVLMLKVAVVAPAATVIDVGTMAAALLELNITTAPPAGAGALRVTVHTLGVPPTTLLRLSVSVRVFTAVTVKTAVALVLPCVAVIVEVVFAETANDVAVNVAVVAPAGTVTVAGTVAAAVLLDVSETIVPPAGAAAPSVTVPVEVLPPVTVDGYKVSAIAGIIVSVDVFDTPKVAVIVAFTLAVTVVVETVKVVEVAPARAVTDAGTVAAASLELRVIE